MLIEKGITLGVIDSFHRSLSRSFFRLWFYCLFVENWHRAAIQHNSIEHFSLSPSVCVVCMRFRKYVSICNWIIYIKFICRQFATLFRIPFNWMVIVMMMMRVRYISAQQKFFLQSLDEKNLFVRNCWNKINRNIRICSMVSLFLWKRGAYERIVTNAIQTCNPKLWKLIQVLWGESNHQCCALSTKMI